MYTDIEIIANEVNSIKKRLKSHLSIQNKRNDILLLCKLEAKLLSNNNYYMNKVVIDQLINKIQEIMINNYKMYDFFQRLEIRYILSSNLKLIKDKKGKYQDFLKQTLLKHLAILDSFDSKDFNKNSGQYRLFLLSLSGNELKRIGINNIMDIPLFNDVDLRIIISQSYCKNKQ